MKNSINLIILSVFAIVLTACSGDDTQSTGGTSNKSNNGYTAEATKTAIDQCMQSGASEALCQCATKELQASVSADEMEQIEADMAAGKAVSDKFAKASAEAGLKCAQAQISTD